MNSELIEKIHDLEARLSFQEDLLNAMNTRVAQQDNEIAKLQLQLRHLNQKIREGEPADATDPFSLDEKPPHY